MQYGGVLVITLFKTYQFSDIKRVIFSLLIGLEYAIIDEIHQLFIDGRSGQVSDVIIDEIGFAIGIIFVLIIINLFKKGDKINDKFKRNNCQKDS